MESMRILRLNKAEDKVITSLDLGGNQISGSVSGVSSLSVCLVLKSVDLSRNWMEFNGGLKPIGISLQVFDLSYNQIFGSELVLWIVFDGCGELMEFNFPATTSWRRP
ncbi:hypothetical protein L6452_35990 [Arctium lappa]|uniref:Uncharacterized protein n=1 Tax=Arctium lappa TaxID=4217 RepID=A0ACB8Y8N9_ARCLA|nr:hypothetical protein L6452_35990 [Arctium lappa]